MPTPITQEKLNQLATVEGQQRYYKNVAYLQECKRESRTDYGAKILKNTIQDVEKIVWEAMLSVTPHIWSHLIEGIDPHVVTKCAITSLMDTISERQVFVYTCKRIAEAVEREAISIHIHKHNKKVWKLCVGKWKEGKDKEYAHREWVKYTRAYIAHNKIKDWTPWTDKERVHLGAFLVDCVKRGTGLFTDMMVRRKGKTYRYMTATDELFEYIQKYKEWRSLLRPAKFPMVKPPNPWKNTYEGGYDPEFIKDSFIKFHTNDKVIEVKEDDLPVQAVNTIQATPWRINKKVLDVAQRYWDNGFILKGMPRREALQVIPRKDIGKMNEEEFNYWGRLKAWCYEENMINKSIRLRTTKTLQMAHTLAYNPEIYFPNNCDFRGRVYAIPPYLNPQGTELAKALLEFAETQPIEKDDTEAWKWLKNHGANCYGIKGSFDERIKWVNENHKKILRNAREPIQEKWWREAGDPFMFLAFCFGYAQALHEGTTNLPCSVDASNNGIQILSLLARDTENAYKSNAIPTETPQDIYTDVVEILIQNLKASDSEYADRWLKFGLDRSTVKHQVMIRPYGAKMEGTRKYTDEWFKDKTNDGRANPFGLDKWTALCFLNREIWNATNAVIKKPFEVMKWLQELYKQKIVGSTIKWTSPSGFQVQQSYEKYDQYIASTRLDDKKIKVIYGVLTDKPNLRSHKTSISPNFVHSLDSACLHITTMKCIDKGITSLMMVHDSYGTHCTRLGELRDAARETFGEVFQKDLLAEFAEGCDIKPFLLGDLDPLSVKDSEYLFS